MLTRLRGTPQPCFELGYVLPRRYEELPFQFAMNSGVEPSAMSDFVTCP